MQILNQIGIVAMTEILSAEEIWHTSILMLSNV